MNIPISLLKKSEADYSLTPDQIKTIRQQVRTGTAVQLDGGEKVEERKSMLAHVAQEDSDLAFERYIGNNDLLPINYLQIGYLRSKAVGRLRYFDVEAGRNAMATGFLISPDLILTNHHVFKTPDTFKDAFIDFDYAYAIDGTEEVRKSFRLNPQKAFISVTELDFTVIGIEPNDITNAHSIRDRGYLVLNGHVGKAGIGDSATIIQYPDGNYQEIALRQNQILDIKSNAIIYVSDTSPGSSGSPVFNDQWQIIALHSAGVASKNNQDQYLDRDGNVIEKNSDGSIDSSRIVWISNTGIRISAIIDNLFGNNELASNIYIQFLRSPLYSDDKAMVLDFPKVENESTHDNQSTPNTPTMESSTDMTTSGGAPVINITINVGGTGVAPRVSTVTRTSTGPQSKAQATEAFENKLDDEMAMDYSSCKGFLTNFMTIETPLPQIEKQLMRKVATYTDNSSVYELKYDHYSTIHHSVRRMPIVSAINIEGNPGLRKDTAARQDKWLRDNRIAIAVQLTDDYYKGSGFDKGHMCRREDAKWGTTAQSAEAAAQMSCMYTNACPQVPSINRAIYGYHGLWGQLEQIVLEKGVELEAGKTSKICVYNGPIFVDTDPTFKGVQVPMRFFKLIVWLNSKNAPRATAFVLSQEDLVQGIQFEELQYDKEFVEHQCSIVYLEGLTGLTFTKIRDYDTWVSKGNAKGVVKVDKNGVESLAKANK